MTNRQAQQEARRLERAGWALVQLRVDVSGRDAGERGRTVRRYGLTAVDPLTGVTGGPWWMAEEE